MAPIKFEENIKDKLEGRLLNPSPQAWQKLSERLNAEPKESNSKKYWWLGVAASFVGLLIVSSFFFSGGPDDSVNTPIIVEEDVEGILKKESVEDEIIKTNELQENKIAIETPKTETNIVKKQLVKTNKIVAKDKNEEIVFSNNVSNNKEVINTIAYEETPITNTNKKTIEDKKVKDVVAQIQKLQKEKSSVTDAEIDALLNQAQKDLVSQRLYDASTKTVDAELLLLQVETDLDQSFRDLVFEALKSGYQKVKTSVAERNN